MISFFSTSFLFLELLFAAGSFELWADAIISRNASGAFGVAELLAVALTFTGRAENSIYCPDAFTASPTRVMGLTLTSSVFIFPTFASTSLVRHSWSKGRELSRAPAGEFPKTSTRDESSATTHPYHFLTTFSITHLQEDTHHLFNYSASDSFFTSTSIMRAWRPGSSHIRTTVHTSGHVCIQVRHVLIVGSYKITDFKYSA